MTAAAEANSDDYKKVSFVDDEAAFRWSLFEDQMAFDKLHQGKYPTVPLCSVCLLQILTLAFVVPPSKVSVDSLPTPTLCKTCSLPSSRLERVQEILEKCREEEFGSVADRF